MFTSPNQKSHDLSSSALARPLVLIPAAGYGVRVGSPPAKECLPHPHQPHKSFIEVAYDRIQSWGADPLLIVREDKAALIDKWRSLAPEGSYLLVPPTPDWVQTLLLSSPYWRASNLLLLPDVEWAPTAAPTQILKALDQSFYQMAFLLHTVSHPKPWGIVTSSQLAFEKPSFDIGQSFKAWGLVGFCSSPEVIQFWREYQESAKTNVGARIPEPFWQGELESFEDLTR